MKSLSRTLENTQKQLMNISLFMFIGSLVSLTFLNTIHGEEE